jgi:hypothetical protein
MAQAHLGYQGGFQAEAAPGEVMKVIQGDYRKGSWQHDREAYSDEEIAIWNGRFRQLMNRYPNLRPLLEFCLWEIEPKSELRVVK